MSKKSKNRLVCIKINKNYYSLRKLITKYVYVTESGKCKTILITKTGSKYFTEIPVVSGSDEVLVIPIRNNTYRELRGNETINSVLFHEPGKIYRVEKDCSFQFVELFGNSSESKNKKGGNYEFC